MATRYLGTVIVSPPGEIPGIKAWIRSLERFRKPIVVLQDLPPKPPLGSGNRLVRLGYGDWIESPGESPEALAMRALADRGHRVVGVASDDPADLPWLRVRIASLRKEGAKLGVKLALRTRLAGKRQPNAKRESRDLAAHAVSHPWAEVRRTALFLLDRGPSGIPVPEREFLEQALHLEPLLRDGEVTALICPNDIHARRQYTALRRAGWQIPEDLSLLSFDNSPSLSPFPISSIDFGLDLLGYQVFHLLFGRLPGPQGRTRYLAGRGFLADHGSLGMARRRATPVDRFLRLPDPAQ